MVQSCSSHTKNVAILPLDTRVDSHRDFRAGGFVSLDNCDHSGDVEGILKKKEVMIWRALSESVLLRPENAVYFSELSRSSSSGASNRC